MEALIYLLNHRQIWSWNQPVLWVRFLAQQNTGNCQMSI